MEYHLHHQEQDLAGVDVAASSGGGGERLPQWSPAETREFLSVRAELDQCFAETKRNKRLWEEISSRMLSKGFYRTPEQCKSKWKNLLTRFKGSEAMDDERSRQTFPYYEEMKNIFSRRVQRLHSLEKEKGVLDPEEVEEKQEEEDDDDGRMKRKRKRKSGRNEGAERGRILEEVSWALKEFWRRQKEREERWLQAAERRDAERREAEFEMRRVMEGIHEERAAMEKRWREREEERWARQEVRAERRDRIIATIFARLDGDNGD
ncbi:hypothetical protein KFK09_007337 [Dendrobium nobile]|uniref:Myb-like domain-containing protein n=1 Tax=Dendrobium nobile TaxID=94219 RepID=A0A8T3BUW5_DENNO|nr:hypothetical protein KFK09_007337 [Dendrobium nobile]